MEPDYSWDGDPEHELLSLPACCCVVHPSISRLQCRKLLLISYIAATRNVQDMMYVKRLLESVGLKVPLPIVSELDNCGGVNW